MTMKCAQCGYELEEGKALCNLCIGCGLAEAEKHAAPRDSLRPDIKTDEALVAVLDELCHRLKPTHTELGLSFRETLHAFIHRQGLDWNDHSFAELPQSTEKAGE